MSSAGIPTTRLPSAMAQWEYRVSLINVEGFFGPTIDLDQIGTYLNTTGNEHWELVTVVDINRGQGRTSDLMVFFKRPIPN